MNGDVNTIKGILVAFSVLFFSVAIVCMIFAVSDKIVIKNLLREAQPIETIKKVYDSFRIWEKRCYVFSAATMICLLIFEFMK